MPNRRSYLSEHMYYSFPAFARLAARKAKEERPQAWWRKQFRLRALILACCTKLSQEGNK